MLLSGRKVLVVYLDAPNAISPKDRSGMDARERTSGYMVLNPVWNVLVWRYAFGTLVMLKKWQLHGGYVAKKGM